MFRLRNILILAIGAFIGYRIASKMREDDPDVVHGPQRTAAASGPGLRLVQGQAQKIADQATEKSLEAIRRTRTAIRSRLGEGDDGVAWN
jgi:hypothetical protein